MSTTMTGTNKSSATTMNPMIKAGQDWDYNEANLTYDGEFDAHGRQVLYDSIGTETTMTGQAKSSATTMTPLTKIA